MDYDILQEMYEGRCEQLNGVQSSISLVDGFGNVPCDYLTPDDFRIAKKCLRYIEELLYEDIENLESELNA